MKFSDKSNALKESTCPSWPEKHFLLGNRKIAYICLSQRLTWSERVSPLKILHTSSNLVSLKVWVYHLYTLGLAYAERLSPLKTTVLS